MSRGGGFDSESDDDALARALGNMRASQSQPVAPKARHARSDADDLPRSAAVPGNAWAPSDAEWSSAPNLASSATVSALRGPAVLMHTVPGMGFVPPLTPRVLAASSAAAASTVAFATTNGTAISSRAAGEVDCVAMQQLLDRIAELEAQLHEERRALGAEVQRVAEAEARADAAEHHVAHTLAGARVRERAANALAEKCELAAAEAEARAAAVQAKVEAAQAAEGVATLIGPEELEALNGLAKQLEGAEAAREAAEVVAEEADVAVEAAEARADAAEERAEHLAMQLQEAQAATVAADDANAALAAAAVPTGGDNGFDGELPCWTPPPLQGAAGEAAAAAVERSSCPGPAEKEQLARNALTKKSMLVHLRLLLCELAADLREPAAGLVSHR